MNSWFSARIINCHEVIYLRLLFVASRLYKIEDFFFFFFFMRKRLSLIEFDQRNGLRWIICSRGIIDEPQHHWYHYHSIISSLMSNTSDNISAIQPLVSIIFKPINICIYVSSLSWINWKFAHLRTFLSLSLCSETLRKTLELFIFRNFRSESRSFVYRISVLGSLNLRSYIGSRSEL